MAFPLELQVTKYVAELDGRYGARWRVFETGSGQHYLFMCVQNSDIQAPVPKRDLQPDVRAALRHGWGHPHRRSTPDRSTS